MVLHSFKIMENIKTEEYKEKNWGKEPNARHGGQSQVSIVGQKKHSKTVETQKSANY